MASIDQVIGGLQVVTAHNSANGFSSFCVGAEHDKFFVYTTTPLSPAECEKMKDLNWSPMDEDTKEECAAAAATTWRIFT